MSAVNRVKAAWRDLGPRRTLLLIPILFLIAGALYVRVGQQTRIPEEDTVVWSNPAVTGPAAAPALLGRYYDPSREGFRAAVRPFSTLALRLEWSLFRDATKTDPEQGRAAFAWVLVGLLALSGCWLYLLIRDVNGSVGAAALAALLLVVHPLAAAPALNIAGMSALLALNLGLAAFLLARAALSAGAGADRGRILACGALLLLAILSDEAAFAFVPALAAWVWARSRSEEGQRVAPATAPGGGWASRISGPAALFIAGTGAAVIALLYRAVVLAALPQNLKIGRVVGAATGLPWLQRAEAGLAAVPLFFKLLIVPAGFGYSHDDIGTGAAGWIAAGLGLVLLALLGALLVRSVRRGSPTALWAGLTFFPLIGALGIVFPSPDYPSERLLFMAVPGVIGLAATGVATLLGRTGVRAPIRNAAVAVILLAAAGGFGAVTATRVSDAKDWETLVRSQTEGHPRSAQGQFDLGNIFLSRRQWAEAISRYEETLKLDPTFWQAWVNTGSAYFSQKEPGLALRSFDRALAGVRGRPEFLTVEARAMYNRAFILMQQDRNEEAAQGFTRMLQVFPDNLPSHANLGFIYSNSPQYDSQALEHLGRALDLETDPARKASLQEFVEKVNRRRIGSGNRRGRNTAAQGAVQPGPGGSSLPSPAQQVPGGAGSSPAPVGGGSGR